MTSKRDDHPCADEARVERWRDELTQAQQRVLDAIIHRKLPLEYEPKDKPGIFRAMVDDILSRPRFGGK